ncbi:hypothetical protein QTP88_023700 [Uroleucon formosanum]
MHLCFHFNPQKTNKKPKMGAEKVTMNIVVVGQVQSAKAIKSVAKAIPATSQLMSSNSSLRSVALMFMMFGPFLKEFNELHNFSKSNSGKNEICSKYFGSKYEKSAPALLAFARRPNNVLASCDGVDGRPLCDRTTSCAHNITLRGNDWRGPVTSYVLYELGV